MDGNIPTREDELADEAFTAVFPNGLPPARRPGSASAIVGSFPLTQAHLGKLAAHAESGDTLGVSARPRARMSSVHRRAASLLANGMDEGRVALLCGYDATTISILKTDPMFRELLVYYSDMVEDGFKTVVEEMADLSEDVVAELRYRLDNSPELFSISQLDTLLRTLADRTGNGPTSTQNVRSVSLALSGADLARVKAGRSPAAPGEGRQPTPLPHGAASALEGVLDLPAVNVTATVAQTGLAGSEGVRLGEEDGGGADLPISNAGPSVPRVD